MATDPEFYGSLFLSLKEPFEVNKILSTGKFQIVPDGYGYKNFWVNFFFTVNLMQGTRQFSSQVFTVRAVRVT